MNSPDIRATSNPDHGPAASDSTHSDPWSAVAAARFPAEFDPEIYRALNSTAARLDDDAARAHYRLTGRPGGFRANAIANRDDLLRLVADAPALIEFGHPDQRLLPGNDAVTLLPPDAPPDSYGSGFDAVLGNHQIQNVPNLVGHLQQVASTLNPGGFYLLMVPDKRYCLDHFQPATTIGAILDAARRNDTVSSWRAQVDSLTLSTHNDSVRHWLGDHGSIRELSPAGIAQSLQLTEEPEAGPSNRVYRTWFFTPTAFRSILWLLRDLGLVDLEPFRVYPTLRDHSEFWTVLRKPAAGVEADPAGREQYGDEDDLTLPFDAWSPVRIPAVVTRRYPSTGLVLNEESDAERNRRFQKAVRDAEIAAHVEQHARESAEIHAFEAPNRTAPPPLTRPVPGMKRVLVSFCNRGPAGILLGIVTPAPVLYFQPLALPDEVMDLHDKAHGLTRDERFIYVALSGGQGQSLLVLAREDLSFQGLHQLRRASDAHSIFARNGLLYVVSTGTDEVLVYPLEGGVPGEPACYWSPRGNARVDLRHYNAIWPEGDGFLIAAMDRRGLFPAFATRMNANGVIQEIPSGRILAEGLWFPHSVMRIGGDLAYAQSGCSTLNIHGRGAIRDLPGWPRGLCRVDHLLLVGTSENPQGGINSTLSRYIRCTITLCNYTTMSLINSVDLSYWGKGIYDLLPLDTPHTGD